MARLRRSDANRRGNAMVIALFMVVTAAGLAFLSLTASTAAVRHASSEVTTSQLKASATAAANLVAENVWDGFVANGNGQVGDLGAFRTFLASGKGTVATVTTGAKANGQAVDGVALLGLPTGHDGRPRFAGVEIAAATIRRIDTAFRTDLAITVAAEAGTAAGAQRETIQQVVSLEGEPFHGFEYALLSNNVNCIMCHATFDSTARYYNKDKTKYGTFDRVRVGTLESLLVRTPKSAGGLPLPYSNIGGSLYVRGQLMDNAGGLLKDLTGSTVTGDKFNSTGLMTQDSKGNLVSTEMTLASGTPLPKYGLMYTNYPSDSALETDGSLPSSFPAPIPDENANRKVDPDEFATAASTATGTINSGVIYAVAKGKSYPSGTLPTTSNTAEVDGSTSSNLILLGTAKSPIQIDGTIAVDGDLVIQGVVKGNGTIIASGNIYVLGDLTYADGKDASGNRTYGVATDGTMNGLALAAGSNVIVGDYLSDKNGVLTTGDGKGSFNFTMSEITIFNRGEWTRTQKTLPDKTGKLVTNPLYRAGYLPRYYALGAGDPVYMYNKLGSGKTPTIWFDATKQTWQGQEHPSAYDSTLSSYKKGDPTYDQAVIVNLGSNANWISEANMKSFWTATDKKHASGTAMEVDSLLYSNNSAWTLVRDTSVYSGKLTLNGSLVAADTGVLVIQNSGTGLQVNYDSRLTDKLRLRQTDGPITMVRSLWLPMAH